MKKIKFEITIDLQALLMKEHLERYYAEAIARNVRESLLKKKKKLQSKEK